MQKEIGWHGLYIMLSHPGPRCLVASAGVPVSPGVERLEILHPALESIYWGSGHGEPSPSDDHCLGVGVLNGTGMALINTITRHLTSHSCSRCIIFETKAWLLAPIRFYQSSWVHCLTAPPSHEICANARIWSPGDVIRSWNIQSEILPGSIDWAPPHTASTSVGKNVTRPKRGGYFSCHFHSFKY